MIQIFTNMNDDQDVINIVWWKYNSWVNSG